METSSLLLQLTMSTGLLFLLFSRFSPISDMITRSHKVSSEVGAPEEPSSKKYEQTRIFIPNVLARWPWPRRINPHYTELKRQANAWVASFQAFSPRAQYIYDRCDFNLLACLGYPRANKEHARDGCYLIHLLFLFDEYSDRSTPSEVRQQKDVIMDALRNPNKPRPKGEWVGGEFARQFWELVIQSATDVSQKRFVCAMDEYLESVVQESVDKKELRILDVESYTDARRRTCAVKPAFFIYEIGLDIPDEVMSHPAIQEMVIAAADIIAFSNDICSYNVEQLRRDAGYNIVTSVMHEYGTDVNGAMLWVQEFLLGAQERFHAAKAALPEWNEPLNSQVLEYCDGVGQMVRANDDWCFESERYFGNKGPEIKENRWMMLLPKKSHAEETEVGPVHVESSLL